MLWLRCIIRLLHSFVQSQISKQTNPKLYDNTDFIHGFISMSNHLDAFVSQTTPRRQDNKRHDKHWTNNISVVTSATWKVKQFLWRRFFSIKHVEGYFIENERFNSSNFSSRKLYVLLHRLQSEQMLWFWRKEMRLIVYSNE